MTARGAGVAGDDRDLDAELVRRAGLALADALGLRGMEGIELPSTLALLLGSDLGGARQRQGKRRLDVRLAFDLAADVTDQPAQPRAQDAQFSTVAVELFGVGITPRHHRRVLGDTEVGLPQPHPVLVGQAVEAFDRRMQQLGVGWEGDVLRLHRGVDRDPLKVLAPQRPAGMRYPQTLGQQQLQFVAEPLSPMAQVGAFVRELVLEKLFPGEELEIGIIDPALAHAFVRQAVNLLQQQQPDCKPRRDPGPALVAVERRDLTVEKVPVDLAGELRQFMLKVDDLVQPRSEQIT